MKNPKIAIVALFLITIAVGAAAIFIGKRLTQEEDVSEEETVEAGTDPENCINPTAENPYNAGCGVDGNKPPVCTLSYCPSWADSGDNSQSNIRNSVQGDIIRLYIYPPQDSNTEASITVNGQRKWWPDVCQGTCSKVDFIFTTKQTDVSIKIKYDNANTTGYKGAIGWRSPATIDGEERCGEKPPANGYLKVSNIPAVESGFTEISVQCWGDFPNGNQGGDLDYDFNDFGLRVAMGNKQVTTTSTSSILSTTTTTSVRTTTSTTIPGATSTISTTIVPSTSVKVTTLPPTGLFDDASNKSFVGIIMIISGVAVLYLAPKLNFFGSDGIKNRVVDHFSTKRKKKFEKKILKRSIM